MKSIKQLKTTTGTLVILLVAIFSIMATTKIANAAGTISVSIYQSSSTITEDGAVGDFPPTQTNSGVVAIYDIEPSATPTSSISSTASISGGCKFADTVLGGYKYGSSTSKALSFTVKTQLAVHHLDTSSYEGTRTCTLSFGSAQSSDTNFSGAVIPSQTITVLDDESAPVTTPQPISTPKPTTTPTTSTPKPTHTTETAKPATPVIKLVDSEGLELKPAAEGEKISFEEKDPILLSGTTVPNGVVKLYIFSEPQEATVTADDKGLWTYTIASIEPGDHRVEVEVTDPATSQTSERAEVLAFSVAQAQAAQEKTTQAVAEVASEKDSTNLLPFVATGVLVLVVVGAGGYWWMRKRNKTQSTNSTPAESTQVSNTYEEPTEPADSENTDNDSSEEQK